MLELLTFTGVDAWTPIPVLADIAQTYPSVEFGVLVSGGSGGKNTIFPSMEIVEDLKVAGREKGFKTAIHLCGYYARMTTSGVVDPKLTNLCSGFDRVQVNLRPGVLMSGGEPIERVAEFADNAPCDTVILPHHRGWGELPIIGSDKIEYLFDRSAGRGTGRFRFVADPNPRYGTGRLRRRYWTRFYMAGDDFRRTISGGPDMARYGR